MNFLGLVVCWFHSLRDVAKLLKILFAAVIVHWWLH